MYPDPNVPPYGKSLYKPHIVGQHNKYHGYTVGGTPNFPLINAQPLVSPIQHISILVLKGSRHVYYIGFVLLLVVRYT